MMKQYFDDLVNGIEAKIKEDPGSMSPRKIYALEVAKIGRRLYGGKERVAWCGVTAPFDLLAAMGITSCFVEFVGAMLASTGMVSEFLAEAEQAGFVGDTCAYHKSVLGAARKNLMPVPDFLIATSCPCTGGLAVMENLARHFKKDLFVLNIPQEETDQSVQYLADQIQDMVRFVSDHTGEPLSEDRFREAIAFTNKAREIMVDVYKMAMNLPSPANGRLFGNFGVVVALLLGTKAAVDVATVYRDSFKEMLKNKVSGIPNERYRLLWIQNRIQFKNPLIDILETQYNASIISDELNDITWEPIDPDNPYISLARRAISIPFNGEGKRRIKHLQQMAKDYRIDGAINPCHWGCRQGSGARGLVSKGLGEIGVPVLNLEVDCIDSRNFAQGQIKTRLEAFIEMLDNRSSPWNV